MASLAELMVKVGADISEFSRKMDKVERTIGDVGNEFKATAMTIGTKALAIGSALAPLIPFGAGLASSFATAGIGVAGFGAVAVGVLKGVFDASEKLKTVQEKIDNAKTVKERNKALEEQKQILAGLSEDQRKALTALQGFKSFWADFIKPFESPVVKIFTTSLGILQEILKGMAPVIQSVADVLVKITDGIMKDVSGGGLTKFFGWLESNAGRALQSFWTIFENTLTGVFNMLMAFTPYGVQAENTLVKITEKFKNWSSTMGDSTNFQKFFEICQKIGDILKILGGVLVDVWNKFLEYKGLDAIIALLDGVKKGLEFVKKHGDLVEAVLAGLLAGFVALKIISTVNKAIGIFNTLMIAFRAGTLTATLAQWGLNTAMLANPIGLLIVAIGALVTAGVLLYKNWDVVKAWLLTTWANIKSAGLACWNGIKSSLTTAWNAIKSTTTTVWNAVKSAITTPFTSAWNTVKGIIDKIKSAFNNLKLKFPKPKMPSFSIGKKKDGFFGFDVPTFKVSWNAKGGIFNKASILGGGQGVGEAGAEAVLPIQNKRYMKPFASAVADHMDSFKSGESGTINNNFNIENLQVREEADIHKIAKQLLSMQKRTNRQGGR